MSGVSGARRWCPAGGWFRRRTVLRAALAIGAACAATTAAVLLAQTPAARAEESWSRAAARAIAHGQHAEAAALARTRGSADPSAAAVLARLAIAGGRYEEALASLQTVAAASPSSDAALELGLLQRRLGRKAEARRTLTTIVADARSFKTAWELLRAGRAAHVLGQYRTANTLFREAAALAPGDPEVNTAWGEFSFERHDPREAARSFSDVLKQDERWAPAQLGLARVLAGENPPAAGAAARRALEIDPALIDAHVFLADLALDEGHRDEARAVIGRALAVNARSLEALALVAAIDQLEGRTAEFEAGVARVLAINPTYGEVYRVAGDLAARNYRFDEAVALTGRAVALEPDNMRAQAELGMHLLRTGDERQARQLLERAFRSDPYDVVTYNLLQLLDNLDKFESFRAGDATVRLDPKEAPVLTEYALQIVEDSLAKLSTRYQFKPRGPILVEVFPRHDDFAVRTLGLPGMLGALGACFGRVVTLDSPNAREPGTFNWQATLHHELAHVFTLQMSNQRVPRWLTEGVSVWEEGRVRPEWARDTELAFARLYDQGKVPKLRDLNAGFTDPDTIAVAYFQASLVVELIVDRYGEAGLHALLRAYGDGHESDAAIQKALGTSLEALQGAFDARVAQQFATLGRALRAPEGFTIPDPRGGASLRTLAAQHRDSYPVQLAVGRALAALGERGDAFAALERAAQLVPTARGAESPRALMAALAEQAGDAARARRELKLLLAHDHTNVGAARQLAALAEKAGDHEARALAYERIVTVDPFDAAAHASFGKLAMERGDLPLALREFKAALAAGPIDVVSAQCDLGEALLLAGRRADAKRAALAALEIAPTFERAQTLLLKCVEGGE